MTKDLSHWEGFFDLLAKKDRGGLAKLRQSLDGRPANFLSGTIHAAGLEWLLTKEDKNEWQREVLETVAGLFALIERPHDEVTEEEEAQRQERERQTLGRLLGELHTQQNRQTGRKLNAPSSIEKRFLSLLGADVYALPYQLRQAVTLLKAQGIKPDWAQLTDDLMQWQSERGDKVRRDWADDFYMHAAQQIRLEAAGEKDAATDTEPTPTEEDTP